MPHYSFRHYGHLMSKKKCARTNTPRYSYFHLIVNSWNILHMDIRTAYCTGNFKFKVKKFLTGKSWFHYTEFFFVCIICIYWSAFTWGLELFCRLSLWNSYLSLLYLCISIFAIKVQKKLTWQKIKICLKTPRIKTLWNSTWAI